MPTYAAYGNNFGITLDAEPDEVAAKLASVPPGQLVEFEVTEKGKQQRYLLNGGALCWIVRVPSEQPPPQPPST
jgi:hypothetical protein